MNTQKQSETELLGIPEGWSKAQISIPGYCLLYIVEKGVLIQSVQMQEKYVDEILRNRYVVQQLKESTK